MKTTKLEIYPHRNKAYALELARLEKAKICTRHKQFIKDYHSYKFSKGAGELTVAKRSSQLRRVCFWVETGLKISKRLDRFTKKDSQLLVAHINRMSERREATRKDYCRTLKEFFGFRKSEDTRIYSKDEQERIEAMMLYDYWEKEVSATYKIEQADPNTIITEQDIDQVLELGCKTSREKAFISLLHETGCRAGEFLNLRVGDLVFQEHHLEIHVPDGKTGRRTIYATKSIPHLLRYLDCHPFKNSSQAFIWLSEARFNANEPILHKGAQKLIDRCFERAGVTKRHNWHWFRHSRASLLMPKLTETMLCKYMGWTLGSKQVKTYGHLSSQQLEDSYLAIHGIKKEESKSQVQACMCGTMNNINARYCSRCYRPTSVNVVMEDKQLVDVEIRKTMNFFMEIAKNPEMLKKFEEFKKAVKE